jgi:hypothetical protein
MRNCSRPLAALLASVLLAAGALACGGASKPTSGSTTAGAYLKEDADKDGDENTASEAGQDDRELLASYGPKADAATTATIAAVVRRYYAVSLAGEAASACALLNAALAREVANDQAPAGGAAHSCATGIAPVLAQQHSRLLAKEPATMTVIAVYAKGNIALAALGFRRSPESDILLTREGGGWKIDALYDTLMT